MSRALNGKSRKVGWGDYEGLKRHLKTWTASTSSWSALKVFKQEGDTCKFLFQIASVGGEAWWGIWETGGWWADEGLTYGFPVGI